MSFSPTLRDGDLPSSSRVSVALSRAAARTPALALPLVLCSWRKDSARAKNSPMGIPAQVVLLLHLLDVLRGGVAGTGLEQAAALRNAG
ncbi:hypothetical protein Cst04h_11530 [Corynebacterium striatum]|uniref:Secreted protein n=1 Tax=Corynebacterium striatum TaxID=43770 RepID=A0ABC9ZME6_CORST|nr:hypothetical protein Cst04h_11530 [Corynebacterium striatum]